ncbi:MAG: SCP2 sterol-binding domain-containing protein [Solirubrobacteraceae bacterium]|nr:SCP2 sterol-binding domain-containing protein [Solirubrobacteraceae bacterium]
MRSRSYDQYCGAARALDVVGERWALLVVRDLMLGPKRYTDLQAGLSGIGPNVLSSRLRGLQDAGVVTRRTLPPPGSTTVYELTELGEELRPVVRELVRWGRNLLGDPPPGEEMQLSWLVVALEASFRPELARGLHESYEYRIDGEVFHVDVDDGAIAAREGESADPTFVVVSDVETFLAVASQQLTPEQAVEQGRMTLSGDLEAGQRSVAIFGVPIGETDESGGGLFGAVRASFRPASDAGASGRLLFLVDGRPIHILLADGDIKVGDGAIDDPDVTITCDLETFIAMGANRIDPITALAEGRIAVEGDAQVATLLAGLHGGGLSWSP